MEISRVVGFKRSLGILFISFLISANMFGQKVKVVTAENYISKCMYNFSWYVNWPEQSRDGDFVFGVIGDKKVYDELIKFATNKKVGVQNVKVLYFNKIEDLNSFCHVVFLAEWQTSQISKAIRKIGDDNTLVITQNEEGAPTGSAINFFPHDGMLQFEVNKSNAMSLGLQVSSRLEKMAYRSL